MTLLEEMMKDAKRCNERYEAKYGKPHKSKNNKERPAPKEKAPTQGEGWRNKPLDNNEKEDILYFQEKGWCLTSTALFLGISTQTVKKYLNE